MNILAPVDKPGEIKELAKVGAREFYCGFNPAEWVEKYNNIKKLKKIQISVNRREGFETNVQSFDSLGQMIKEAEQNQSELYLTLNASYYPEDAYEFFYDYLKQVKEIGVHNVIAADLGLICFIREQFPDIDVIVGCCSQVENILANQFFADIGVRRITFPHHMTVDEIINISNSNPNIEYECFVLEGRCIYDIGRCNAFHAAGFFCHDQWDYEYYPCNGGGKTYDEIHSIRLNELSYTRWTKPYLNNNQLINNWKKLTCGLCAIPLIMRNSNVKTLKIAGRGGNIGEKILMVRLIRKAIKLAEIGDFTSLRDLAIKNFSLPEMCDNKTCCLMPSYK